MEIKFADDKDATTSKWNLLVKFVFYSISAI